MAARAFWSIPRAYYVLACFFFFECFLVHCSMVDRVFYMVVRVVPEVCGVVLQHIPPFLLVRL